MSIYHIYCVGVTVGGWNWSKARVLLFLYLYKRDRSKLPAIQSRSPVARRFTVKELADNTGVPYGYARARLSRWYGWQLVLRSLLPLHSDWTSGSAGVAHYALSAKGSAWLFKLPQADIDAVYDGLLVAQAKLKASRAGGRSL